MRAPVRRARTEVDWLASRTGRADVAVFHEFQRAARTAAATSSCSRSCGELERRGAERRDEPALGRDAGLPLQLVQLRLRAASALRRDRRAHGAPRRRPGRRLSRLRRRHRPAHRRRSTASSPTRRSCSREYSLDKHRELGLELRDPVGDSTTRSIRRSSIRLRSATRCRRRLRVIATSWSDNPRKGADVLEWLDRNLDLDDVRGHVRREHAGAVRERIRVVGPLPSRAARRPAACSTTSFSPPVATTRARTRCSRRLRADCRRRSVRSGGHPELVGEAGIGFDDAGGAARRAREPRGELEQRRAAISCRRSCRRRRPLPRRAARMRPRSAGWLSARTCRRAPRRGRRRRGSSSSATTSAGRSTTTAQRLTATARRLGYDVAPDALGSLCAERQAVFHHDHFDALQPRWLESSHRLGLSYFHGRPGTDGYPEFDRAYETLRRHAVADRPRAGDARGDARARASRRASTPEKVFTIPIGVDLEHFPLVDESASQCAQGARLPESAFVVGSFLKDGVGLGRRLEPKLVKGPDTLVAVLERLRELDPGALRPAHRAGARLRPPRARAPRHPAPPRAAVVAGRARAAPITRSTSASSRRARRAGRKRCSSRWRPACRSSRRASARRRSSSSTARTACSPTSTTSTRWLRGGRACPRRRGAAQHGCARRACSPRRRMPTSGSTARWAELLEGFVRPCGLTARVSGATRGQAGAGRACCCAGRGRRRDLRVFYGHDLVPAAGRAGRRRHGEVPAARRALPQQPDATSRCSISARPGCRATSAPLLRLARRRGVPVVVNQDGVAYPGWAGDGDGRAQRAAQARTARGRPRPLPEPSSARTPPIAFLGEPRGSWEVLYNAVDVERFTPAPSPPGGRAGAAARRRPDAGVPARARAAHARACPRRRGAS